mgnify:CR=1 FL=1
MAKNRSRRLRKKMHIDEFQELGFSVAWRFPEGTSEEQIDKTVDDFINEVIEPNKLAFDGSGYLGLREGEIHPHAKLVAVADVFDALLSPRPYKRPWSIRRTCDYLSSLAGVKLDAKFVGLLLEHLPQALALYREGTRIRNEIRIPAEYAHRGREVTGPCCCRRNNSLSIG